MTTMPSTLSLPLKLIPHPRDKSPRPATAWLIVSPKPERWLTEIARWKITSNSLSNKVRFCLIPTSAADRTPAGALILLPNGLIPKKTPLAIPYCHLSDKTLVPAHADVLPALTASELERVHNYHLLVLHPALGPIGFQAQDTLPIHNLFAPLERMPLNWDTAVPGIALNTKIKSVAIRFPSPTDPQGMPPLPSPGGEGSDDPSKDNAGNSKDAKNASGSWLKSQVQNLLKMVQSEPSLKKRESSIQKLLEQLQSNPDEALKFAISLGSTGASRGASVPSDELSQRDVNFDLRRIGGGNRASEWDLSIVQQAQLRQHYLRLAERERALGRHRRAAYIYSALLGDLNLAAKMLEEGQFYQEAAVIYKDHLKDLRRAAEAFIKAGLFHEAIAIYQELRLWERLANLHTELDQPEEAKQALYSWVNSLKNVGELETAADILFNRIKSEQEAVTLLESAWPNHRQAFVCISKLIKIHGTTGHHAKTAELLKKIAGQTKNEHSLNNLLSLMVDTKNTYPDLAVQRLAEDVGRSQVAHHLANSPYSSGESRLITALVTLGREDNLLRRDAFRFMEQRKSEAHHRSTQKTVLIPNRKITSGPPVELITQFTLKSESPSPVRWFKARAFNDYFIALGFPEEQPFPDQMTLHLIRSNFLGQAESSTLKIPSNPRFYFSAHSRSHSDLLFFSPFPAASERVSLPKTDLFQKPSIFIGQSLPSFQHNSLIYATTFSSVGDLWLLHHSGMGLVLSAYHEDRALLCQIPLDTLPGIAEIAPNPNEIPPCNLLVLDKLIALSIGSHLYTWETTRELSPKQFMHEEFAEPILELIPGPRWARLQIAIRLTSELYICWPPTTAKGPNVIRSVKDGLSQNYCATFTGDGSLISVDQNEGFLFDCSANGTQTQSHFQLASPGSPAIVIPAAEIRQFVAIQSNGLAQVWQINQANRIPR